MQTPVEISQVFTTPAESLEMTMLSLACRLMDSIMTEWNEVVCSFYVTLSVDKAPSSQNLADLSSDIETRQEGEENIRDVI